MEVAVKANKKENNTSNKKARASKRLMYAADTGTRKYRDDYGHWIPIISYIEAKALAKRGYAYKIVGETQLKKAWSKSGGIVINGFRYRVGCINPFSKCIGYIITDDEKIVRLTKKLEWPKLVISLVIVATLPYAAYKYLNSDGTWEVLFNSMQTTTEYRDNFNYDNQVVSRNSSITISNNTYNPATLQYILYENGIKMFDTGILDPGEDEELKYSMYFENGEHNLVCETIATSVDGSRTIEDKKTNFTLTVRD